MKEPSAFSEDHQPHNNKNKNNKVSSDKGSVQFLVQKIKSFFVQKAKNKGTDKNKGTSISDKVHRQGLIQVCMKVTSVIKMTAITFCQTRSYLSRHTSSPMASTALH